MIADAIVIINGKGREFLKSIKIKNSKNHEIQIDFKGYKWEVSSSIAITKENLVDPERDCGCRVGSESGLCPHFWIGFIISVKQGFLNIEDWIMTKLPSNFKKQLENITIKQKYFQN